MVLYPIHLGAHWCLAAVDFRHHQFHYYDSLLCSNGSCLSHLRAYLVAEARNKKGEELNLQGWTDVVPKVSVPHCLLSQLSFCLFPALHPLSLSLSLQNIPMQKNGSDCGVFTCMVSAPNKKGSAWLLFCITFDLCHSPLQYARYLASNVPFTFSQVCLSGGRGLVVGVAQHSATAPSCAGRHARHSETHDM